MKARQILLTLFATISLAFVANAQAKAEGNETPEGLYMTKTVTKNGVNSYTLQLESFVTGVTIPGGNGDVMLILDLSGSMKDDDKLVNLKAATKTFINELDRTECRISIVTFEQKGNTKVQTSPAFVKVKDNKQSLLNLVDEKLLQTEGATAIDEGTKVGLETFRTYSTESGVKRYCVILTDGEPGTTLHPSYAVAQSTWQNTHGMKKMGVTVYTVFLGIDGITKELEKDVAGDDCIMNVRNFLDGTSSNFPTAYWNCYNGGNYSKIPDYWAEYRDKGKPSQWKYATQAKRAETKFFKEVANPEDLSDIFQDIAKEAASASIDLNAENSKIIDKISNDFSLPASAFDAGGNLDKSKISLYALHCTGKSGDTYTFDEANPVTLPNSDAKYSALGFAGVDVNLAADKKTLTVTGFDFEKNFVAWTDARKDGYKLVIKIPTEIDPAGVGGMNVPTNDPESGIYYDEKKIGDFKEIGEYPIPYTDLPNIIVVKNGLKQGESAVFSVYKEGDKANATALVVTQGESEPAIGKIKLQQTGRYIVEETIWSWAYNTTCTSTYTKDDGNTSTTANSITRNVNADTQDDTLKGTVFEFTNTAKESTPAHAEASINNKFNTIQ